MNQKQQTERTTATTTERQVTCGGCYGLGYHYQPGDKREQRYPYCNGSGKV
jgi:hypothetical protein